MLAGEGRRGHLRRALRRVKAVPRTLRNDSDHSSTERERLRPVLARDFQCRSAVKDVNKLAAGERPVRHDRVAGRWTGTMSGCSAPLPGGSMRAADYWGSAEACVRFAEPPPMTHNGLNS
jgi:hypothetical protein